MKTMNILDENYDNLDENMAILDENYDNFG